MEIKVQFPLRELTTLKVGGNARYFCLADSLDDLKEAFAFAKKQNVPILILGGGSNLLIGDEGFAGLVIKINFLGLDFCEVGDLAEVIAGAGENWDAFVATTIEHHLSGLENLSGIPGTVGGTPVQNVGAYGVEVKDSINWVEAVNVETGEVKRFSNQECHFGYRNSFFKTPAGKKFVIVRVSYLLSRKFEPNISYTDLAAYFAAQKPLDAAEVRVAVIKIRAGKFPDLNKIGTAGSFFKNPIVHHTVAAKLKDRYPGLPTFSHKGDHVKLSLAWILDKVCFLKGFRHKSTGLFEKQPLVLVNYGDATAEEIKNFSQLVKSKVQATTGIEIEEEVQIV